MPRSGGVAVAAAVLAVLLAVAGATPMAGGAGGGETAARAEGQHVERGQETTAQANESDSRLVTEGFEPGYDAEAVLSRVERLRELSATDPITLHEYADESGSEIDRPDRFGEIRPPGARALQLYSNATAERRQPLGYAVQRPDGVHVHLMNASDVEAYGVAQEVVLAHELVHALQFQRGLLSPSREEFRASFPRWTTDAQLVTGALVEGDAMWTTDEYAERYGGDYSVAEYNRTLGRAAWPDSVAGTPYYYGYEYYRATGGSPDERSATLRDPPNATAELLHPGERVSLAELPDPPNSSQAFDSLTRYHEDTVGELVIRHALRLNGRSYAAAAEAADGWTGDRMYYYTREATTATHWVTAWESPDEAAAFADAWRELLDARGARAANGTPVVPARDDAPAVRYVMERDGAVVRITAAPSADLAERLAAAGRR